MPQSAGRSPNVERELRPRGLGRRHRELPGKIVFAAAHVAVWYAASWVLASRRIYIKL